jgi:hypothetical protein
VDLGRDADQVRGPPPPRAAEPGGQATLDLLQDTDSEPSGGRSLTANVIHRLRNVSAR